MVNARAYCFSWRVANVDARAEDGIDSVFLAFYISVRSEDIGLISTFSTLIQPQSSIAHTLAISNDLQ